MTKRIEVAVGVIVKAEHLLIAKRPSNLHQGDKWEFPGGKVEPNESVATALSRELHEELGITVTASKPWFSLSYDYPDKQVLLSMHVVTQFNGEPEGKEGQPLQWVSLADIAKYDFPAANQTIIDRLPDIMGSCSKRL